MTQYIGSKKNGRKKVGLRPVNKAVKAVSRMAPVFALAFIATFLASSIFTPINTSNATETTVTAVVSSGSYSINLTVTPNVTLNLDSAPTGAMTVGRAQVSASTNSPNGYKLYLGMTGTNATTNDLVHSTNDTYRLHSSGTFAEPAALTDNTWGYALEKSVADLTGLTNQFSASYPVEESATPTNEKFAAIPTSAADPQLISKTTTGNAGNPNVFYVYYGVRANYTAAAGSYTNKVLYTGIADAGAMHQMAVAPNAINNLGGDSLVLTTTLYSTADTINADAYILTPEEYAIVSANPASIANYSSSKMTCTRDTNKVYLELGCTSIAKAAGNNYVYVNVPDYDTHYATTLEMAEVVLTVDIANSNTTSSAASINVVYGGSATVTVTPDSGYYLSGVSCPSGYTCSGYNTGTSYTGQQTVTVTNNNTTSGGTLTFTGTIVLYMQDQANINACKNAAINTSFTLTDSRDGNEYTVKKLKDGKCWMTQNLRLVGPFKPDKTDSDVTWNKTDTNAFELTASNSGTWCTSSDSSCIDQSMVLDSGNNSYGTYYNWYSATAGTGTYSSMDSASSSICPKGWRLPTGGDSGEFQSLYNQYNSTASMQDATNGPGFVLSGYRRGSTTYTQYGVGDYWSSIPHEDGSVVYGLEVNSSDVYDIYYLSTHNGVSVRCVAK